MKATINDAGLRQQRVAGDNPAIWTELPVFVECRPGYFDAWKLGPPSAAQGLFPEISPAGIGFERAITEFGFASNRLESPWTRSGIERMFMKAKPQYLRIGNEEVVVLSKKDYERLAKKADEWEPPLPEPNARGNYSLDAMDIVMAQEIIRARRQLGLTQAELAQRAGIRVETLNRIELGKH